MPILTFVLFIIGTQSILLANNGPPNMLSVLRQIKKENPQAWQNLKNQFDIGQWHSVENSSDPKVWEFIDRSIQKMHSIDSRFGYRLRHRGQNPKYPVISVDTVGIYYGTGDPQGDRDNHYYVDFIKGRGTSLGGVGWHSPNRTQPYFSQWIYPRPGALNYGYDPNHPGPIVGGDGSNTGGTASEGCNSNQKTPHWQEVDGVCKPSCGHAGNIYCKANDCSGMGYNYGKICNTDRKVRDLTSYQTPCCLVRDNNSRSVCKLNQNMPRWKSVGSECLPSCKMARRLYCKDNNCDELRPSESCKQSDNTEVQNLRSYQTPCCLVGGTTSSDEDPDDADNSPPDSEDDVSCDSLQKDIKKNQQLLAKHKEDFKGSRWSRLRRLGSSPCKHYNRCKKLANDIHLAKNNKDSNINLKSAKKSFGKHCKHFNKCHALAHKMG